MTTTVPLGQFVGPPIRQHARGAVAIHESDFDAGGELPLHDHDLTIVSLVLTGSGSEVVGSRERALRSQDVLFTPAFSPHGYRFDTPGRWFNMQFSDAYLGAMSEGASLLPETSQIVQSSAAAIWAARVRSEVRENDAVSALAIDGAMRLMIAELTRVRVDGARVRPRWLRAVEEALDESVAEPPSIDELARLAGVHATHLIRTFRRYHGTTISTYVRRRRIERARIEVARAERPLSVIALDAGFADQSHFTRVFRKTFGETPGQYARSLRA